MASINELSIISYNCKGFKPRNFDYIRDLFKLSNVLLLQETWLYNFEDQVIRAEIPNSIVHTVSSMSNDDIGRVGRPFGGLAIITHKSLPCVVKPIQTNTNRILAVELVGESLKILLVNIYLPVKLIDYTKGNSYSKYLL